jgi:membrane-associated phospholipid phosphatase
VLLAVAATVGLSRIMLGMHFLTDVIAGSAIGSLLGAVAYHVVVSTATRVL